MTNPTSFRENLPGLVNTTMGEIDRTRSRGNEAENEFFSRSLNFDAREGAAETARGIGADLSMDLNRNLERARGTAVGMGRLETGFFDQDRGRLFEDFNARLANAIAQQSLQAESLNLQNNQSIGAFGQNVSNRFVNLLGGATQAGVEEQSAQNQRGGLFGRLLGGAAGMVLPGIGNEIGRYLGDEITGGK